MSRASPHLSIVLPVYDERESLAPLFAEIAEAFADVEYEIIAVDDGSTDGSHEQLRRLAGAGDRIRVLSLERNRGQTAAFLAGFDSARGGLILTMDADGQNDPADGRRLLRALAEHAAVTTVIGYRSHRVDGWWRRCQSWVANAVRDVITGDVIRDTGCSLKLMPADALRRVPRFDGMHRFLPTLLRSAGQVVMEMEVSHRPRRHGRSKYGMWNRLGPAVRDAFRVRRLLRQG